MRAERRHELQENELAAQLGAAADFFRAHGIMIAVAVVAVTVVAVGSYFYADSRQFGHDKAWEELANVGRASGQNAAAPSSEQIARDYERLSREGPTEGYKAIALTRAADTAIDAMLDARQKGRTAEIDSLRSRAKEICNDLRNRFAGYGDARAVADFGLAFIAEDEGKVDEARRMYEAIATDKHFAATPFAIEARHRIEVLSKLGSAISFAPARPKPAVTPLTLPPVGPAMPETQPAAIAPAAAGGSTSVAASQPG